MRADRWLTLSVARHFAQGDTGALPILMYHSISSKTENRQHPYYDTTTRLEIFHAQVEHLRQKGYRAPALRDALDKTSGPKVVFTFDDGFEDFLTAAWPVLRSAGFSATVFLPTSFIGDDRKVFLGTPCLTWREVRLLHSQGVEFGSHTVSHSELVRQTRNDVRRELSDSRHAIEDHLGTPITSFSYPYAFPEADREFVSFFRDALNEAGYKAGVTTRIGRHTVNDDPFLLKRLPINSEDDIPFFGAKLEGAYDWMHSLQIVFKTIKTGIQRRTFSESK